MNISAKTMMLALNIALTGGCSGKHPLYDVATTPSELAVKSYSDLVDKIRGFNSNDPRGEIGNPEIDMHVEYDQDKDGLKDFAFMASNDSKNDGYSTSYFVFHSNDLTPEQRGQYASLAEEIGRRYNFNWAKEKNLVRKLAKTLPYPIRMHRAVNTDYP